MKTIIQGNARIKKRSLTPPNTSNRLLNFSYNIPNIFPLL
jgi:hypothetical protein